MHICGKWVEISKNLRVQLILKLNIASLNFKFLMINRVSDHENGYETLFDVKTKIGFGMSSIINNIS